MSAWQLIVRGENGVAVLRCPEGHLHVEVEGGVVTLRLSEEQFIAFIRTMLQAERTLAYGGMLRPFELQPIERFSRN